MTQTRTAPFMSLHVSYSSCPVCKSESFEPVLTAKDHTVTQESFTISSCNQCGFRFTSDAPSEEVIHKYYKSSAYVSHSDTKKGLVNLLYHAARFFTMMSKEKLVKRVIDQGTRPIGILRARGA